MNSNLTKKIGKIKHYFHLVNTYSYFRLIFKNVNLIHDRLKKCELASGQMA